MPPKNKLTQEQQVLYKCTGCGILADRDKLTVKKALFQRFGRNGKWLRSRVVAWLCEDCRDTDSDWNLTVQKGGKPHTPSEEAR